MSTHTTNSASAAAADTSNLTVLPNATERRIAAVHRAADKIRTELDAVRKAAWSNGLAGRQESIEENTAGSLLLQAVGQLQALALGSAEEAGR